MNTILAFAVRLLLLAVGLAFAALVACLFVLLWAVWSIRALWARITGRPVHPFVMRTGPRAAFEEMMRRAEAQRQPSRTPRADAAKAGGRAPGEVTDVEPK